MEVQPEPRMRRSIEGEVRAGGLSLRGVELVIESNVEMEDKQDCIELVELKYREVWSGRKPLPRRNQQTVFPPAPTFSHLDPSFYCNCQFNPTMSSNPNSNKPSSPSLSNKINELATFSSTELQPPSHSDLTSIASFDLSPLSSESLQALRRLIAYKAPIDPCM